MFSVRIKGSRGQGTEQRPRARRAKWVPATRPGARGVARTAGRRTDVAGNARRRPPVGPRRRGCGEAARPRAAAAGGHFWRRSSRAPVVVSAWVVFLLLGTGRVERDLPNPLVYQADGGAPPAGLYRHGEDGEFSDCGSGPESAASRVQAGGEGGVNGRCRYRTPGPISDSSACRQAEADLEQHSRHYREAGEQQGDDHADHLLQDSDVAGDLAHLLGCRERSLWIGAGGDVCHVGL